MKKIDKSLRDYFLRNLVYSSFAELSKNKTFMEAMGKNTQSALEKFAKNLKIDMIEVYCYGIEHGHILPSISFLKWLKITKRHITWKKYISLGYDDDTDVYNQRKLNTKYESDMSNELESIKAVAIKYGLDFSTNEDLNIIVEILKDLSGGMDNFIKEINVEKIKIKKRKEKEVM